MATFGIANATGVHIVLIKLLFDSNTACLPCFITALGAFIAFLSAILGQFAKISSILSISSITAAIGLILVVTLFLPDIHANTEDQLPEGYRVLLQDAKDSCTSGIGQTCIVIFERPGCAACNILKDKSEVQRIERLAGSEITIARRTAGDSLIVPTVAVRHGGRWVIFKGAPTDAQLEELLTR